MRLQLGLMLLVAQLYAGVAVAGPPTVTIGDFTPDTTRLLGDPAFLPLRGQVEGQVGYSYTSETYDTVEEYPRSVTYSSYHRAQNGFTPNLRYGVTDDLTIAVSLPWANASTLDRYSGSFVRYFSSSPVTATPASGPILITPQPVPRPTPHRVQFAGEQSFHFAGAQNPAFSLTWRGIDQRKAPINFDLTLRYSPDIFDGRVAGQGQTGSIAIGGQSGGLTMAVSRETRFVTALGYAGFTYIGGGSLRRPGGYWETEQQGRPIYEAGIETQTRPFVFAALNAGLAFTYRYEYDTAPSYAPARPVTVQPGSTLAPYVGVLVPFLSGRAAADLTFEHDFITDERLSGNVFVTGARQHQANRFTARALFLAF